MTEAPFPTYNDRVIDTTENGDQEPDDVSRVWELRPRFHVWSILVPLPYTLLILHSFEVQRGVLFSPFSPYQNAWEWLCLTATVWLYWVATVQLVYLNSARRVRIAHVRGKPVVTIWTRLPLEPVISPDRIRCFRTGWPGQISIRYRARTPLWRIIRTIALLPEIGISRKQFSDELRWKAFLNTIVDSGLWSGPPMACSDYPPVYPETPCSRCGLTIPAYEARCPSCATPRRVECTTEKANANRCEV